MVTYQPHILIMQELSQNLVAIRDTSLQYHLGDFAGT